MLAVIDGSRALRSAIEEFLGDQVEVARCQQHKAKNVKDYLPKEYHAEYGRKMTAAWAMTEYDAARRALAAVVKDLGRINIQAAASLDEGFEETLTLHRLGVPPVLRVHLATTNLLESPFHHARRVMRNVKRWRPNTNQAARWIASGLLQVERRMRRITGYRSMSVLRSLLEADAVRKTGVKQTNAA
jgi:transposase-like protein